MTATFKFKLSYMNTVDWTVTDDTGTFTAEYRTGLSAYECSIYNGTPEEYRSSCGPLIGWLRGRHGEHIKPDTVLAYNDWRRAEHARWEAQFAAHPEKYGTEPIEPDAPTMLALGSVAYLEGGRDFRPVQITLPTPAPWEPRNRVVEVDGWFYAVVEGRQFGAYRSRGEARGCLQVEQRRANERMARAAERREIAQMRAQR